MNDGVWYRQMSNITRFRWKWCVSHESPIQISPKTKRERQTPVNDLRLFLLQPNYFQLINYGEERCSIINMGIPSVKCSINVTFSIYSDVNAHLNLPECRNRFYHFGLISKGCSVLWVRVPKKKAKLVLVYGRNNLNIANCFLLVSWHISK